MVVHDAINVLQSCRSQFDVEWLIAQGQDAGINFDEAFLANYEHLLLRLQSQLITELSRKALELLLLGDYDKKQHRLLSWFTEFSNKPRPLSTSLDIKPSLAVLWGVCWMFYNNRANTNTNTNQQANNGRVPRAAVLQNVVLPEWRIPEPTQCEYILALARTSVSELMETDVNFGMELIGTPSQPAAPQRPQQAGSEAFGGVDLRLRNAETWMPTDLESGVLQTRQGVSRVVQRSSNRQGLDGTCARSIDSLSVLLPQSLPFDWFQPVIPRVRETNMA